MSKEYTIKRYMGFVSLVLVFVFVLSTEARAELYPFEAITPTNSSDADAMAEQLSLEVIDLVSGFGGQVEFKFNNNIAPYDVTPGLAGVITEFAFEDGTLLGIATVIPYPAGLPGSVVDVVENTSPPAGTWGLDFDVTHFFRADAESPSPTNGVNPGEAVGIVFDLFDDKNFDDVITALELGFTTSNPSQYDGDGNLIQGTGTTLRIGIHVQNLGDSGDYSDAFILTPEPGSLLLGSIGIGMVIARCRKRKTLIES